MTPLRTAALRAALAEADGALTSIYNAAFAPMETETVEIPPNPSDNLTSPNFTAQQAEDLCGPSMTEADEARAAESIAKSQTVIMDAIFGALPQPSVGELLAEHQVDRAALPMRGIALDYARKSREWQKAAEEIAAIAHREWRTCNESDCRAIRAIVLGATDTGEI